MTAIINGDSPSITFSDATTQATSAVVSGKVPYSILPTGSVLQVVQGVLTSVFTTTSTSYVDTGLTVSITPKFSNSKILVLVQTSIYNSALNGSHISLVRNSTNIFLGDAAGSRSQVTAGLIAARNGSTSEWFGAGNNGAITYLDSPATTSSTVYKIQAKVGTGGTFCMNQGGGDGNDANWWRSPSSIVVMEIAG